MGKIISETTVVCQEAELLDKHSIAIEAGCVLHPKCSINAEAGPIVLSENVIVEEQAVISNTLTTGEVMKIGPNNIFEVGSRFENSSIGSGNLIQCKAIISHGCRIGSNCTIGAGVYIEPNSVIPDNTILYGYGASRSLPPSKEHELLASKMSESLQKVLPKFHHLQTTSAPAS
mmetsp:Transcript_51923/g.86317  ORF Transcript_51923/g.86317 Transcript_51923/m.86317 type:complete len:174 (+) Transcript_51923:73-594(+)